MKKDSTPTSSPSSPDGTPTSKWNAAVKRFAVSFMFFVTAVGSLLVILSHVTPALLAHILRVFVGLPIAVQALCVVCIIAGIGLWAGAKQIQQAIQRRDSQSDVQIGSGAALEEKVVPPLRAMLRLQTRIAELLERFTSNSPPNGAVLMGPSELPVMEPHSGEGSQPYEAVRPLPSAIFIGRAEEQRWLVEMLNSHGPSHDTTVVYGISGIGKSVLIDEAIKQVEHVRFKGAVVHIHCRDLDDHFAVLRSTLEWVSPNRRLPPILDLEVLRQISEQLLTDRERLLVLDGVEPGVQLEAVVYALRTSQHSAHLLITTTSAPSAQVAPITRQLHLQPLGKFRSEDGAEIDLALELFAQYAGNPSAQHFGQDLRYAQAIVEALERHTYALQLMGAYVQLQPGILKGISDEVRTLQTGKVTPGLEGVLKPVWYALTATLDGLSRHNSEALKLLYAFVTALNSVDVGRLVTRSIGNAMGLRDKDTAIYDLLRCGLVVSRDEPNMPPGSDRHRLHIHTLLFGHIRYTSERPEWAEIVTQSRNAAAAFFAQYIRKYDRRDLSRDAQQILEPDEDSIIYSIDWAISNQHHEYVVALAHGMRRFWLDRWRNDLTEKYMSSARDSATQLADRARQQRNSTEEHRLRGIAADLSFTLGRMYRRTGRLPQAEPLFQLDLAFRKQQRQYAEQAEAYHQLAQLERSRGNMKAGLRYCRKGLAVVNRRLLRAGPTSPDANTLIEAKGLLIAQWGRIERSRGNLELADRQFKKAFDLFKQSGDVLEQGVALGYRGRIARVMGNLEQATAYFQQSSALAFQGHDVRGQGVIATQFGRIARTRGDIERAKREFEEGYKLAQQVLDMPSVAVNLNYLGRIANTQECTEEAKNYFTKSLDIAREIGDRLEVGVNLDYLGRIARQEHDLNQARQNFAASLKILRQVEDRRGQALVLAQMALLDLDQGDHLRARWRLRRSLRLIRQVKDRRSEGTIQLYLGQLEIAVGSLGTARTRFNLALTRAQEVGDAGGDIEAKAWLDKVAEMRRNTA